MDEAALEHLFHADYHSDRAAFVSAVESYAHATGRSLELHRLVIDSARDLVVTIAEFRAAQPEKLYVVCTGIHGIEGYAGAAITRLLLASGLRQLDMQHTSLLLVHALNPFGFAQFQRVNANNVDLNRNCEVEGEALFAADSSAYRALASLLAEPRAAQAGPLARAVFYARILAALARHGAPALRQATLSGQYVEARGIFYGGKVIEPEIAFFQQHYVRLASIHREVLLTDLHTGYGERGQAYPLFARADSAEIRAFTDRGVSDASGHDKTYTVHGDLVGYCFHTAKRLQPDGCFNGLAIEIGTHGLRIPDQMHDLFTVVCENRLRNYGASDVSTEPRVREAFCELFNPRDRSWRLAALRAGVQLATRVLRARDFLPAAVGDAAQ
jgi:hypothetical protein